MVRRDRRSTTGSGNLEDSRRLPRKPARTLTSLANLPSTHFAAASQSVGLRGWLWAAGLLLTLALVYQPAWHGGFIWDDDLHLLDNPVLKPGGLATVWTPGGYINYWPLTFTSYKLQFMAWGLNPFGFHLVNIAVHGVSALLLWRILLELRVPGALFAAAIFALHPVNVESVAWIAQLKGLLAVMLALVSLHFFLAWERGEKWGAVLAIGAFLLSTLAKGMVITLPAVLLACAWWQRGRIERQDLLRVLPYLAIGAVMTGTEIWSQHLVAADGAVRSDDLLSRAAVAGCAVWFYFWKLIWPLDLCFVYPRWRIDEHQAMFFLAGLLLVGLFALAWWRRLSWGRPVLMLFVGYVGLLLPALGFVNIYYMRYSYVADHWQYAAMIVPCAVIGGAAATLLPSYLGSRKGCYLLCAAVLATLSVLTWRQSHMYADIDTLYLTIIKQNPECWLAYNNLGKLQAERGNDDEARAYYERALKFNPDYAEAHNNLAIVLARSGNKDEAIDHYQQALRILPDYADAHYNLGNALTSRGPIDEAIVHYQRAVKIKPDYGEAYNNLGLALARCGRVEEAAVQYQLALKISPDFAEAHYNLAAALEQQGRFREAADHRISAVRLLPNHPEVLRGAAWMFATCPDSAIRNGVEATNLAQRAAEISGGGEPIILDALAAAYAESGRFDQAVRAARRALELATARGDTTLVDMLRSRIKLYESGKAFRNARSAP